jgi:hypothetical protein
MFAPRTDPGGRPARGRSGPARRWGPSLSAVLVVGLLNSVLTSLRGMVGSVQNAAAAILALAGTGAGTGAGAVMPASAPRTGRLMRLADDLPR